MIWLISSVLIGFTGCRHISRQYTLATGSEQSRHFRVGKDLSRIIEEKSGYKIKLNTEGEGSISNCQKLVKGEVDFALAQNDVPLEDYKGNIRTILPLYPQLFFIIHADSIRASSLPDLVRGRKIAIGPASGGTAAFTRHFFNRMGIDSSEYTFVYSHYEENTLSDSIPISISVTGFNNSRITDMLQKKGGEIWSLDALENAGRGSLVDGFCLQYPYARPFIIPKYSYYDLPQEAKLTLALDNVLLASKEIDSEIVYDLVSTVLDNRELLINRDVLFRFISEELKEQSLQFPLHEGTKNYLNRDKPSFYERYAELLALLITVLTLFLGALSTLWRWNRRRQKERIDAYYLEVIELENRAKPMKHVSDLENCLEELDQIRQKAFQHLVKESLVADDSFRIFITLIQDVTAIIEKKIGELESPL